jgi:hypothetical protein
VVPQAEAVFVETAPMGERPPAARRYKGSFGRQRGELTRDDVSAAFVVEWQLQPLGEGEAAPPETPRIRLHDLSA